MDQALEKLGIYDLIAVLLSGLCISTISAFAGVYLGFYEICIINTLCADGNVLCFLIISYLVGVVFQEIGSFFGKKKYPRPELLEAAIEESEELKNQEMPVIRHIVRSEIGNRNANDEQIYNYCRYYLIAKGRFSRANNDQSIAGFSRSMAVYLILLGFVSVVKALHCAMQVQTVKTCELFVFIGYLTAIMVVFGLLSYRHMRFVKMRYEHILRSFYYYHKIDVKENEK